ITFVSAFISAILCFESADDPALLGPCAAGPWKVSNAGNFSGEWTGHMGSGEAHSRPTAEDLLRRVAGQDRAAYRALYDATAAKLFGVALRICKERSLAEEAFQEAFIGIWRTAADFEPARGSALAWMAG